MSKLREGLEKLHSDYERQWANLMNGLADSVEQLPDEEVLSESCGESTEPMRQLLLRAVREHKRGKKQ